MSQEFRRGIWLTVSQKVVVKVLPDVSEGLEGRFGGTAFTWLLAGGLFLATRTSHRTAWVSSWPGSWIPPEQVILENRTKIPMSFIHDLPQKSHFVTSAILHWLCKSAVLGVGVDYTTAWILGAEVIRDHLGGCLPQCLHYSINGFWVPSKCQTLVAPHWGCTMRRDPRCLLS